MPAVPQLETTRQPATPRKKGRRFNVFPLIGVLLAIAAALLTYGGLFLLLADG